MEWALPLVMSSCSSNGYRQGLSPMLISGCFGIVSACMHTYVYSRGKLTALFALVLPAFVLLHPIHSRAQNGLNPQQLVIVVISFYEPKQILHLHLPLAMVVFPYAKFTGRCAHTYMHQLLPCIATCTVWYEYTSVAKRLYNL